MFQVTALPAFNDNYIWILQGDDNQIAVVDPGDATPVLAFLEAHDLGLDAILVTHHHADHTGGIPGLLKHYSVPVYGPNNSPCREITHPLADQDQIELFGQRLLIKAIPGHTLDHICYLTQPDQQQLFCGDTLFLAGCGRLFEGSAEQMLQAMQFFNQLPDFTQVYCAHEYSLGNLAFALAAEPDNPAILQVQARCAEQRRQGMPTLPSSIGQEKRINPFLRYHQASVKKSMETRSGKSLHSEVQVFSATRQWKDVF